MIKSVVKIVVGDQVEIGGKFRTVKSIFDSTLDRDKKEVYFTDGTDTILCKRHSYSCK